MYNINYQNRYIYGGPYTYYLNNPNPIQYTYDLTPNINNTNLYPIINNNVIRYKTPTQYLKPIILQPNHYYKNYNYINRTPTPSPIKKPLIKDYNQLKLISKSPEPYIRLNNHKGHLYNNNKLKDDIGESLINLRINNIKKINNPVIMPKIIKYGQEQYRAKTPEPNIRKREKLKRKHSKKNYDKMIKTIDSLKKNNINNVYQLNKINVDYLNTPNLNEPKEKIRNTAPFGNYPKLNNLSSNNYYYQINNYPTKYIINEINSSKIFTKIDNQANNNIYKINERHNRFKQYDINSYEPSDTFNSAEFILVNQIGEGSFGKIYCVQWIKNNQLYAMKKLYLQNLEELKEIQEKVKMVKDLYRKTYHYGFVRIYGDKIIPLFSANLAYNYYIIMELAERDWEKEIQIRLLHQKYYTEYELLQITIQLVKTLSLMQKNKVSHRDIKPQNILIKNGLYKICDFGEARVVEGSGILVQQIRGSQLFMSPILFYAYNHSILQVMHNTYKSDVFSLGMCILLAAYLSGYILYDIRELVDIQAISNIIHHKLKKRYSTNFLNLIIKMLQIDENLRMDFIQLESYIMKYCNN